MLRGALAVAASAILASLALVAAPAGAARPTCALADGGFHAALVVHGATTARNVCVAFNAATPTFDSANRSISGEEVLALSKVIYQAVDWGGDLGRAVCQVDAEPATPSGGFSTGNCLGYPNWVVWHRSPGGDWMSSRQGITSLRLADGDAEGLSRGGAALQSPSGLCPPAQPWPATTAPVGAGSPGGAGAGPGGATAGTGAGTAGATTAAAPTPGMEATPSAEAGAHPRGRGGPGGSGTRPLSSTAPVRLLAPTGAMFATLVNLWSMSGGGWVAAVAAILALTGLLLVQVWLTRRNS
jgi:hypothetical protein